MEELQVVSETMSTADWRWAAEKGFWNPYTRCWNQSVGGLKAYLFQRNLRRAARTVRQRLKRPEEASNKNKDSNESKVLSKRPDSTRTEASESLDDPCSKEIGSSQLLHYMRMNGWAPASACRFWIYGYNKNTVIEMFNHIPENLKWIIFEALNLYDAAHGRVSSCDRMDSLDSWATTSEPYSNEMLRNGDCECAWECDAKHGCITVEFCPVTLQRSRVFINSRAAEIFGMTRQEMVDCFVQNHVPLALSPLDALRHFLVSISDPGATVNRRHYRLIPGKGCEAFLVSSLKVKTYNAKGQLVQSKQLLRVIDADEYDAAVRLSPHTSPLAATGDLRSGRRLLADAAADAREGMPALARSERGRAELENLLAVALAVRSRLQRLACAPLHELHAGKQPSSHLPAAQHLAAKQEPDADETEPAAASAWVERAGGSKMGQVIGSGSGLFLQDACGEGSGGAGVDLGPGCAALVARRWWAGPTLRRFWVVGYELSSLVRILGALPPHLDTVLERLLLRFHFTNSRPVLPSPPAAPPSSPRQQTALQHHLSCHLPPIATQPTQNPARRRLIVHPAVMKDDQGSEQDQDGPCPFHQVEAEEVAMWEANASQGFVRIDFDPVTQCRRRMAVTSATARLFGMHREEAMARLARREMPVLSPDEDTLRIVVFELANLQRDEIRVYGRNVLPHYAGGAFLFCRTSVRNFDAVGRLVSSRHHFRVISPDEYDAAVRLNPASCPLAATGDLRSGRRLLADAAGDLRRSMASLASTPAGRTRLDALVTGARKILDGPAAVATVGPTAVPSTGCSGVWPAGAR